MSNAAPVSSITPQFGSPASRRLVGVGAAVLWCSEPHGAIVVSIQDMGTLDRGAWHTDLKRHVPISFSGRSGITIADRLERRAERVPAIWTSVVQLKRWFLRNPILLIASKAIARLKHVR
jgi:hypothetical protein